MKNAQPLPLLLALVLLASSLPAQTATSSHTDSTSKPDPITAARSPYLRSESDSSSANTAAASTSKADTDKQEILAQYSRPGLGSLPIRPPGSAYPGMWSNNYTSHHAATGALIGFAVGATAGALVGAAKHPDGPNRAGDALVGSLLFGGLGAAAGAAIASFPGFPSHRHHTWNDEGYDEEGSSTKPHPTTRKAADSQSNPPAKPQIALADIPAMP